MSDQDKPETKAKASAPAPSRRWLWNLTDRVAISAAIGSVGTLLAALIDTSWVRSATPFSLASSWLAIAGLLVPFGLLLGLLIGTASWLLHPQTAPTFSAAVESLKRRASGRPADVAAFAPLAILGLFAWATLCAHLARIILAFEAGPALCGLALALSSLALAGLVTLIVLALTPPLRRWLAVLSETSKRAVDPSLTLTLAVLIVVGLFWWGMKQGTVSGEGGTLGIYGVFKRQELDLRLPGLLAALCLGIYALPPLLPRLGGGRGLVVGLVPLCLTWVSSGELNASDDLTRAIERHAPVSRAPLRLMQRLSDGDRDGVGSAFGGGDCNDDDPAISPAAEDLPDNGIDEDCSGSDLSLKGIKQAAAEKAPKPSRLDGVPKDGNLLLITIDTLRYDLGYMGYKRNISEKIDAFAEKSTIFERAYSLASYTGKSVGPTLIGKYGSETHRNWGHFNKFSTADTFVAERFQRAGIHTISVQAHHYFGVFGGLERGFDELDLSAAPPKEAKWAHDSRITSGMLTDATIAQLDKRPKDKRFFAWVHYLDPHADYKRHKDAPSFGNKARGLYDGEVWYTDQQVGRLLDYLKKSNLSENTSVIITSDHGEAFGENKMWRHGFEVWEVLVRVPLIIHVPKAKPRRIEPRRSLIDMVPTMLDLMRMPPVPPTAEATDDNFVSGQSLLGDIMDHEKPPAVRDVLIDMPGGPYNESRRAYIHGDLKLIISRGAKKELYDLSKDPKEARNIWHKERKRIEGQYAAFKRRLKPIVVKGKRK